MSIAHHSIPAAQALTHRLTAVHLLDGAVLKSVCDFAVEKSRRYAPGSKGERKVDIRIIDKKKCSALKAEYLDAAKAAGSPFLGTNDLIMAGVSEIADEGLQGMLVNLRGRAPIAQNMMLAGNFGARQHWKKLAASSC